MNWNIIVIDDRCKFPLHVWRYVGRSLGFGVGAVGSEGKSTGKIIRDEEWIRQGESISTQDGKVKVWWVNADNNYGSSIRAVAKKCPAEEGLLFLVDVHGKWESIYDAELACSIIKKLKRTEAHWLVSAYYSTIRGVEGEVLPKSRETLEKVFRHVYPSNSKRVDKKGLSKSRHSSDPCAFHVLVTGAGFEIRAARGGFGLPLTRDILEEMEKPFCMGKSNSEDLIYLKKEKEDFPAPHSGIWGDQDRSEFITEAAKAKDLDVYWDVLLGEELRGKIGSSPNHEARESRKTQGLIRETRMREAFRLSLLKHDWGYMNQSVDAAHLDWRAWLTTNYTQFADRAIALTNGSAKLGPWRIISTAEEARVTLREESSNSVPEAAASINFRNRYLFKLHGDIGHLHTMAIAGHDKDPFSALSMPMDDLYQVYASAQRFLLDLFYGRKDWRDRQDRIVWHIVGHGLQDKSLCNLIEKVSLQDRSRHIFLLVNPYPGEPMKHLEKALGDRQNILGCQLDALSYMALLKSEGLPSLDRLPAWLKRMAGSKEKAGKKELQKRNG